MRRFFNLKTSSLLVGIGLFVLFGCNVEFEDREGLVDVQEPVEVASSRTLNVTIIGTVLDPTNGEPIERARVQIGNTTAFTNHRGRWAIRLSDSRPGLLAKITAVGHVNFIFPVFFNQIQDGTSVFWDVDLPPLPEAIAFTPGRESISTYEYNGVTYTVMVAPDATERPTEIFVGPGATVVGEGISGLFAIAGIDMEVGNEYLVNEVNFEHTHGITITYDALEAAESRGIGSINPAALEKDAPASAQHALREHKAAIKAAKKALTTRASPAEATAIFIAGLYGSDVKEVVINRNGTVTIINAIEGTHQPGTGVITDDEQFIPINEEGEAIDEESQPLQSGGSGQVIIISHQGTVDGGG